MEPAGRGRKARRQKNVKRESDSGFGEQRPTSNRTSASGARIGSSGLGAGVSEKSKARKTARIDAIEKRRLAIQKIKRERKKKKGK